MGIDRRALTIAVALAAAGAGCTVGPDFARPPAAPPAAWAASGTLGMPGDSADVASRPVLKPFDGRLWWSVFDDPVLDALVDEAVRQSLDLQTAAARIAEARAQREVATGAELPTVGVNGVAGRTRMSEHGIASTLGGGSSSSGGGSGASASPALTSNIFQVGFDAVWELDLWGKTRRNVEAASAAIDAAEESRAEAAISLTAEVARNYLSLRGLQRQRTIVRADIADQQRRLALVESSARSGLGSRAEVAQQAAQLAATRAELPPIEQNLVQTTDRLALLLALPPGALAGRLGGEPAREMRLPPELPIGLPGDLLRRRPDVARAEAELHVATARVGVSKAAMFPSVEIGGIAALQSTNAGDLTQWGSRFFAGGLQVSAPLFQGGRLRAQTRVAEAQVDEASAGYRQTVLSAYHDANNALVAYLQEQRHAGALALQLDETRRSRALALARYRSGLSSYNEVLDTDRSTRQAELAALQSSVTASTDLVALYKALGGDHVTRPQAE